MRLQEFPRLIVGPGPVFSEDADTNQAVLRKFVKSFLHGDPNVAAGAGRSIAVNHFYERESFLASEGEFALKPIEGFANYGQVGFEVDGLDG